MIWDRHCKLWFRNLDLAVREHRVIDPALESIKVFQARRRRSARCILEVELGT